MKAEQLARSLILNLPNRSKEEQQQYDIDSMQSSGYA